MCLHDDGLHFCCMTLFMYQDISGCSLSHRPVDIMGGGGGGVPFPEKNKTLVLLLNKNSQTAHFFYLGVGVTGSILYAYLEFQFILQKRIGAQPKLLPPPPNFKWFMSKTAIKKHISCIQTNVTCRFTLKHGHPF